jgi:hypothetical protein
MDPMPLRRNQPLIGVPELELATGSGDTFLAEHLGGYVHEQIGLLTDADLKWVLGDGCRVRGFCHGNVGQPQRVAGHER